ncbi:MAG TPA: glycosyltransferase family 4 protein [Solirubrobacteraceae bacterium]|jgi:glycosyltransferase involved in cell wall biosynthesis|nr:glycosyltransferase family 4 protein [Solirubrobacteraceae bacterium]
MYPPHSYGGYEHVWHSATEHLRARGHDVRVLTTDTRTGAREPDPPHVRRELRWHLEGGEFAPLRPRERLAIARHNHRVLDANLANHRPDVFMWWAMGGLTLTLLETVRRRGIPAVAFVHDDWLDYGRYVDPWLSRFTGPRRRLLAGLGERLTGLPARVDFAGAASYVFVSEHVRRRAQAVGLALRDTSVAHSGIDPALLDPAPEREWRWRLLYVGRLDPRKGVATAIEALAHLPAEARLDLVGGWDAAEERRLRALADRTGLADRVAFHGHRERAELPTFYAAADAVVFPVVWDEPWGLVPLEAMAQGRPVIATGRGGSAEYLRDGENCLLFEAGDAAALAGALRRLAGDPELRARLRAGGLDTAPRHTEPVLNAAVERAVLRAAGVAA